TTMTRRWDVTARLTFRARHRSRRGDGRRGQHARRCNPEPLERQMAAMLAQEAQEALVVFHRHVEQLHEETIVAVAVLQTHLHDLPQILARDVARHEYRID